ncbi:4Fe-4S binding protein [Candidatus Fermentibacteria bacterium]|nr:4Fe-4S binding protein [Candidatus Fermentibacteria bacterium]
MSGVTKTVLLEFPPDQVGKPLVSRAVRGFEVEINILHARISPSEVGRMLAVVEGEEPEVEGTLDFLSSSGVRIAPPGEGLALDEELCTHCGACAGLCPTGAFTVSREDWKVALDMTRCIACGICVEACPYGAVTPGGAFGFTEAGL